MEKYRAREEEDGGGGGGGELSFHSSWGVAALGTCHMLPVGLLGRMVQVSRESFFCELLYPSTHKEDSIE